MITFLWPWLWLLLPAPLLARRWLPPNRHFPGALKIPFYAQIQAQSQSRPGFGGWHRDSLLPLLIWFLLVATVAQPLWVGDDQPQPISGRDLMLLLDVSGSMRRMDFQRAGEPVSRLDMVKQVAGHFVEGRRGDRVGLILFGDKAYLRASPSHDHAAIQALIAESEIALAGESTAIGDAIGLAIKRLQPLRSQSRVAILLTDGANNEGRIAPRQAAQLALQEGIRIYTIGVGAADSPAPNPYGVWSSANAGRFEQAVLQEIAETTQGRFFHVLDAAGLQQAYDQLDRLEPALGEDIHKYYAAPLYPWPLALALLLSLWRVYPKRRPVGSPEGDRHGRL